MYKALKKIDKYRGACHADDLFYIFTTHYHEPPKLNSKEFKTIERMVGIFTSFAIAGDPNCKEISHLKINPCDEANAFRCINITENDVTEIEYPELSKLKAWDSVYEELQVPIY